MKNLLHRWNVLLYRKPKPPRIQWHFCCQWEHILCMQTRISGYLETSSLMWFLVSYVTWLIFCHNTFMLYDLIYIWIPFELLLNVCMCTKHVFSHSNTWLPRLFSLHIFDLILFPLVYLAEKVLSPSTSKWLWSFVQYFTFQISEAHSRKWQPRFVHSSITAKRAHTNNNISIVIWRRSSGND